MDQDQALPNTHLLYLLGWIPPQEWRGDRGCVVPGLESSRGVTFAGVVESGYGRELVDQLPQLTRHDYRNLQATEAVGTGPLRSWVR